MKTELLKVCDALVTAGLNGVLQGILLLLLVMLGMRWFGRRTNATTRHAVYLVALLFLALLIPANGLRHFLAGQKPPRFEPPNELAGAPRENHLLQPVQPITHNTAGTPVAPAPTKPSPLNFVFLPLPPEQLDQQCTDTTVQFDNLVQIEAPTNLLFQAPAPFSLEERRGIRRTRFLKLAEMKESETLEQKSLFGTTTPPSAANAVTASTVTDPPTSNTSAISGQEPAKSATETASIPPLAQAILEAASAIEASATEPSPTMWDNFKDRLVQLSAVLLDPISLNLAGRSWIPAGLSVALVTGCALFAAFRLGLVGLRLRRIRQLKFEAFEASPELDELFSRLCAQTHAKRKVTLGVSETQRSAVLLGFRNPKILLPAECDVREAEPVLRHELAHLSRRDDWANLCQQLIHATLFFHPGVWWVCRQLTLEREIACDDCVLEKSTPRSYALLLATLAGRMQGSPALLAPGVSTNKSQLQQRIDMYSTHIETLPCASPKHAWDWSPQRPLALHSPRFIPPRGSCSPKARLSLPPGSRPRRPCLLRLLPSVLSPPHPAAPRSPAKPSPLMSRFHPLRPRPAPVPIQNVDPGARDAGPVSTRRFAASRSDCSHACARRTGSADGPRRANSRNAAPRRRRQWR